MGNGSQLSARSLPHTAVKITNTSTGTHTQAATNIAGVFDAPFLDPGPSRSRFDAGFQTVIREGIDLQLNQTARVDAQLKVGSQADTVTVNASAVLNSDDSQRGTNFNEQMIEDLPTVGRDPSYLALMAPGTSSAQSNVSDVDTAGEV